MRRSDVLVIGAGVSGLTAAWTLRRKAPWLSVHVLEASSALGGWARTVERDGYRIESGPQTLLLNQAVTLELLTSLGLLDAVLPASPTAHRRWLATERGLTPFPESPLQWLRWTVLDPAARVRLLGELLVGAPPPEQAESVATWLARRLGPAAASVLADAGVAGVSGGLARHTDAGVFHRARGWERDHGSLVLGAIRARLAWKRTHAEAAPAVRDGAMVSFREGMGQLPQALADAVGRDNITLDASVRRVVRDAQGWKVTVGRRSFRADALVVALPPKKATELLQSVASVPNALRVLHQASLEAWTLGYAPQAGLRAPEGFGWLCTPEAVRRYGMLGAMSLSSFFPDFGPPGWTTVRVMAGGLAAPQHPLESAEAGERRVLDGLSALLGWNEAPSVVDRQVALDAIPQVLPGQAAALTDFRQHLWHDHGVAVSGWGWRGIGLHDAIATGVEAAQQVVERMSKERARHVPPRVVRLGGG